MRTATADPADLEALTDFALRLAFETEDKTLDRDIVYKGVLDCIQNPKLGLYFLAWDEADPEKKMIGTTMLTYEMNVALGGLIYWIQSVYVVKEARRKGCFRSLYNTVVDNAKADPLCKCVRLYVETENEKAMATYENLGMDKMTNLSYDEVDFEFSH